MTVTTRRLLRGLARVSRAPVFVVAAATAMPPTRAVQTQRIPQFENAHVKVWKSIIAPNAPLPPHRHEHGRVLVALQGGTMKIADQSGASDETWETGKAYWLPANAPNTLHSDINTGDRPIEVIVVEVKDDK
jgi:quercetin dioxygenase-like cupin family protein